MCLVKIMQNNNIIYIGIDAVISGNACTKCYYMPLSVVIFDWYSSMNCTVLGPFDWHI